jgi:hypothetical protein
MAHFAKLDDNNIVLEVHVVNNAVLDSENEEASGVAFLIEWSGGYSNWKQTSYNKNIRKNYAGIGFMYDAMRDAFIPPKPYPSWTLNEETCNWEPPAPKPKSTDLIGWRWNEEIVDWEQFDNSVVA